MAHNYLDALREERAAAGRRGDDTAAVDAEIERITGKIREEEVPDGTDAKPEALGDPSEGDVRLRNVEPDPDSAHAGHDVHTAGGGSATAAKGSRSRSKPIESNDDAEKSGTEKTGS